MAWLLLVVAGVLEIGWPLGFKLASVHEKYFYLFIAFSVVSMGQVVFSFIWLRRPFLSVRHILFGQVSGRWALF